MKKILSSFLISAVCFTSIANASFSDISSTDENYSAITSLVDQGILEGYEDGTFLPDNEVNRAEALKIILMGVGIDTNTDSVAGVVFEDVKEDDWFFDEVSTAVALGIVKGYDDGTFLPTQTVNRAEALKMLMLAAEVTSEAPSYMPFPDVNSDSWYSAYADYAKTWNIEPPQTDGLWHPSDAITRGNISEMVYRMQLVLANGVAFEESTNWLRKYFPALDISMKVPFGWNYEKDGIGAVWLSDEGGEQLSPLVPYDNGGTILISKNINTEGLTSDEVFSQLENNFSSTTRSQLNGIDSLVVYSEDGVSFRDWYVYLENGAVVHFMSMRGLGDYQPYLEDYLEAMVVSIEFSPGSDTDMTVEEIVAALQEAIQVDGVGEDMMNYLTDFELIETDSIGVGTGPVDYYYSPSADITVKYERSFDVILDIQSGETSAF